MATTTPTSVAQTAVPILGAQGVSQPGTGTIVISNLGTNPVFVGGPNVTATTGVQIGTNANLTLAGSSGGALYAIAATGTNNVVVGVF